MAYTEAQKNMSVESLFLQFSVEKLRQFADRIEVCLGKLNEDQIWARGGENENAIGNLALHLAGNVRPVDYLFARRQSGYSRDRDSEFAARGGFTAAELSAKLRDTVEQATQDHLRIDHCAIDANVRDPEIPGLGSGGGVPRGRTLR